MTPSVQAFFDNYAEALLSFSPERIADFYSVPMAVYSDQGVQTVDKMAEVVAFWKQGIKPYQGQNIAKAIPMVLEEKQLSETIFISEVRWNNYDSEGKEVANETNFYILAQHKKELKICGLVIMKG